MSGSLPSAQTRQLLSILFASKGQTFKASSAAFTAAFAPASRFAALCSALLLLKDSKALLLPQRLATWYLLFSSWPDAPIVNPFIGFIFKACSDSSTAAAERGFCLQLLTQEGLSEQLELKTPQDYVLTVGLGPRQQLDDSLREQLQQRYVCLRPQQAVGQQAAGQPAALTDASANKPTTSDAAPTGTSTSTSSGAKYASGTSSAPDADRPSASPSAAGPSSSTAPSVPLSMPPLASPAAGSGDSRVAAAPPAAAGTNSGAAPRLPAGTIEWLRPAPVPLALLPGELRWLYPDLHTELIWDSTLGESGAETAEVQELVARALRTPLLPAQQQRVLAALDANPRLVHRLGVLPQHLPSLVEHCPALASALLLRMLRPWPSGRASELLGVLARSEMSLHGMEVVNRLAASVELPPEFIHLYITNCINSCVGTQDKYVQSRLVRLVCVFLQSLIRNRILAAMDLLHELQAFCINFSRIREAAKLFRLLKQIEAGGAGCLTPSPSPSGAGPGGVSEGSGGFTGGQAMRSSGSSSSGTARGGAGAGGGPETEADAAALQHAAVEDDNGTAQDELGVEVEAAAGTMLGQGTDVRAVLDASANAGGARSSGATVQPGTALHAPVDGSSIEAHGGRQARAGVDDASIAVGSLGTVSPPAASCGPSAISETGRGPIVLAYGEQQQ